LRGVQGREATLQKGRSTAIVELTAPGGKGEGSIKLIAETQPGTSPSGSQPTNLFAMPQPSAQTANPFAMPQPGAPPANPFATSQPAEASPDPRNAGPQNPFAAGIARSLGGSAGQGLGKR
jgi:hypothetical protein